jgi:hypothetical protein
MASPTVRTHTKSAFCAQALSVKAHLFAGNTITQGEGTPLHRLLNTVKQGKRKNNQVTNKVNATDTKDETANNHRSRRSGDLKV